nr:immunoglobulin heavy chain junction region [Macaca mulatta]MOW76243.1 immunoglobulin heavy chain junction region [Macaca mulatta]MOW78615.1 immunoglobulin heavy chain junction region [Macaca mulatta]MOW79506.1 immunoglobulin heavy chain junction region [Macaca mulatta]MOW82651.1 immunoglobulin heavy chain junction region [Macaca mulatta]
CARNRVSAGLTYFDYW